MSDIFMSLANENKKLYYLTKCNIYVTFGYIYKQMRKINE